MNWEAIGAVAELCGSFAVLITLVYLAYQLKQQNKVTRAQIEQQRADSVNQVAAGVLAGENKDLITRALLDEKLRPTDLTPQELVHLKVALSPLRANLENAYLQHKSGFISDELYDDVSKNVHLAYGNLLIRFELPMTKGFKKELTETLKIKVSN